MSLDETLLSVVDALYDGALDHAGISTSLDAIARVIGASGGLMYLADDQHRIPYTSTCNFDLGPPSMVVAEHAQMLLGFYRQMSVGSIVHVHSYWPIREMLKSSYYEDVLKGQDVMYGAACVFHRTSGMNGVLTFNRSERSGPFDESNFRVLQTLAPHLRRAVQVTTQLSGATLDRENFIAALDRLAIGLILTDHRGKALHLNAAAEQMLASADGIAMRGGYLVAHTNAEQRSMERLIGLATAVGPSPSLQRSGTSFISRPSGKRPWLLLVAPCGRVRLADLFSVTPVCLVIIRDTAMPAASSASELRQVFGLSMQEAKVAVAIAEGRSTFEVAGEMGLSALTVRNHLQRIFVKTNTVRQAELVRLVGAFMDEAPPDRG